MNTPVTFEQLLDQYQDLIARCAKDQSMGMGNPSEDWKNLLRALENELKVAFPDNYEKAAKMLAVDLVSRMQFPDGGGAVGEGELGGGHSAYDDPDLQEQLAMEMPPSATVTIAEMDESRKTRLQLDDTRVHLKNVQAALRDTTKKAEQLAELVLDVEEALAQGLDLAAIRLIAKNFNLAASFVKHGDWKDNANAHRARTKRIEEAQKEVVNAAKPATTCSECDGEGRWFDASHASSKRCNTCNGTGKTQS